jgi:hypothetical protein
MFLRNDKGVAPKLPIQPENKGLSLALSLATRQWWYR